MTTPAERPASQPKIQELAWEPRYGAAPAAPQHETARAERAPIWIGDALRVRWALSADTATSVRILALLGLREESPDPSSSAALPPPTPPPPPLPSPHSAAASRPAREGPPRARDVRAEAEAAPPDSQVPPLVERTRVAPLIPRDLPPLAAVLDEPPLGVRLEPADLLAPQRQRAALTALCSGPAATGEVDVAAIIDRIARGKPLTTLPAIVRTTTRRGLQLLIDHGEAMTPFARDQEQVRRTITQLCGPGGLEVVRFSRTPLDEDGAGSGPRWTWRPYRPQPSGRPVLALTDLGALASPAERTEVQARWLRFAALLSEAGCPLVALTPVPLRRHPPGLRRAVAIVVWDRTTGVRHAVTAGRRAGGRVQRGPT